MICLQKILLCYDSMESHCVCTHFSASPSSLTGSYFCKAAFCFVSCFPAFAHTRLSLMPSLPLSHGQGVLPPLRPALLSIPPHSTIFTITGSALRTLCLFILKDGFPVYYCQTISFNTKPCATCIFFPQQKLTLLQPLSYRHLQALYWFVLPALPAQSPCCQVSGSVYFLQLFSPHIKVKADIPVRPLLSVKMDFHCGQKYKYLSCDLIQKTEFKQSPLSVFTHNKCKNTLLVYFL